MSVSEAIRISPEMGPLAEDDNDSPLVERRNKSVRIIVAADNEEPVQNDLDPTEDPNRTSWSNKAQFYLSIIGYSVGLGNIWRFPYLCQKNGGGAFIFPFLIMVALVGVPLFLIESGIGQKFRLSSLGVWNTIHPWCGGIGISSCVVAFFVALYYNVIIAWCLYYLYQSLNSPLPWSSCPIINGTTVKECELSSETAYYWYRVTLDATDSIDNFGGFRLHMVVSLFISWAIVYVFVMKGVQSSGKVVYFTSLFPYLVLGIFCYRACFLEGAGKGIMHMLKPKYEMLTNGTVWFDAATQVFYSFGLAFGSLIAFGSYNNFHNNCVNDVKIVSICNVLTALIASVIIFAVLGFKANVNFEKCKKIYNAADCSLEEELDTVAEGTGLAFIVFTQAIVEIPGSPFWSVIFFLMLLSLGFGSQIGIMEGMLCTVFEINFFKKFRKPYITGVICAICFLVGLVFTTGAGEYWLTLFDSFAGTIGLVVIALSETAAVIWVYGYKKFSEDIFEMTNYKPGWYWQICWRFVSPALMVLILLSNFNSMINEKTTYQAWKADIGMTVTTAYPTWVMYIAVVIIALGICPVVLVLLFRRFQCLKFETDIQQGSIRRNETTVSTRRMMNDTDPEARERIVPLLRSNDNNNNID